MTNVNSQGTMNSINLHLNLNNNNINSSNSNNKESLISLDKHEIVFDLNQVPNDVISNSSKITNLSQSVSYKSKNALRYSQLLTIHNNTSHTLGIKIYFVIEEFFAAKPRSIILSSYNDIKVDIKFYYNKHKINGDNNIKASIQSNKMKIEAFVIPDEYINEHGDVSEILKQLKEKKIQIKKNSIKLHTRIIFKHDDNDNNNNHYNSMNNKHDVNMALKMSMATAKSEMTPEEEKELKDLDNEISKLKVIYNDLICKYNEMTKKYLNKSPKTSPSALTSDTSSFLTNPTLSSRIIPINILIILSLISFLIGIYFTA